MEIKLLLVMNGRCGEIGFSFEEKGIIDSKTGHMGELELLGGFCNQTSTTTLIPDKATEKYS